MVLTPARPCTPPPALTPRPLLAPKVPTQVQNHYPGSSWRLRWQLRAVGHTELVFTWQDAARPTVNHHVRLLVPPPGAKTLLRRRCELALGGGSGGGDTEGGKSRKSTVVNVVDDTYDWLRFRSMEFAEHVARVIRERTMASSASPASPASQSSQSSTPSSSSSLPSSPIAPIPIVYDGMGGSCWFPLLVKQILLHGPLSSTKVPVPAPARHAGVKVKVVGAGSNASEGRDTKRESFGVEIDAICSDIDAKAIEAGERDFAESGVNGTFLVGDLFQVQRLAKTCKDTQRQI